MSNFWKPTESYDLYHYVSPYYDPVKAHEYYMRTRELKGRKSTKGLNESGRKAASYVKSQIYEERDRRLDSRKTKYNSDVDTARTKRKSGQNLWTATTKAMVENATEKKNTAIEQHTTQTKSKIESLSAKLKNLSAEDKKGSQGEAIRSEIASLRENNKTEKEKLRTECKTAVAKLRETNKTKRAELSAEYKTTSERLRTEYKTDKKAIREEADNKYIAELDKLKSDAGMTTKKKRK